MSEILLLVRGVFHVNRSKALVSVARSGSATTCRQLCRVVDSCVFPAGFAFF
jgi:hypothetical protein